MEALVQSRYASRIPGAGDADDYLEVLAPHDRQPIAEVARANAADVEQALSLAAARHNDPESRLPVAERVGILERAAAIMADNAEVLAVEAAREGGKPLPDSQVEVTRAIDCLKICVETLRTDGGEVIPMGATAASAGRVAFTTPEPIGPVVAVSAFNHPLNLIAHQVGPAVATGCPVIVKPAKATPLSCFRFVDILREAGLPEDLAIPLLPASHELSTALVTDPRVAFFSFIGSAKVGWSLKSKLAPGTRSAMEHGGVAPVIVAADADLDQALPLLAKGGFYHAGQVCVSVQRIYADRRIAADLAERLSEKARGLKVGDPTQPDTEVGPLIEPDELQRVHEWVREAADAGGRILCGGEPAGETTYQPTVILNPPDEARVSTEEVFGPVVCVYACDDIDEAIRRANALEVSFQAAVFTRDIDTAMHCYRRLNGSAVMVNDHTAFRVDWMPFAGLKHSGYGVGGIPYTMHDMSVRKLLVLRSSAL